MTCGEILETLRADKPALDKYGVTKIAVFGSMARGDARVDSDVDILVDFREDAVPGLFDFLELKAHIEELLGRNVDLVMPGGLHPALKDDILNESLYA